MARRSNTIVFRCLSAWLIGALTVSLPSIGSAVEWRGSVNVAEIYTDNLTLASGLDSTPENKEVDAWVTRVQPSIGVSVDAERVELDLDYSLEGLFYSGDSKRNILRNQLASYGVLRVIGDELWLRGSGLVDQVNVSPENPLTTSNVNATGNRSDVAIWTIGPQWQRPLFGKSELDASFSAGRVNYDEPEAEDSKTLAGRAVIRSRATVPGEFSYELAYDYNKLDYDNSADVEVQSLYGQLGYQVNEAFQLTGLVGLDSDFSKLDDSSLSERRWEAGFTRKIGKNDFTFSFGKRYWGETVFLEWIRRQTENRRFRASYNEAPSAADLLALQGLPVGEVDDFDSPDSGLDRRGRTRRFIRKRADIGFDWGFHRTSFYVGVYWEQRDNIDTDPTQSQFPDEDSWGASANFSRELGYKTVFTMSVSHSNRELILDPTMGGGFIIEDDTLLQGSAALSYELGAQTILTFETRYNDRGGAGATSESNNFEEFAAELGVSRSF